jgi:hypothetical protein
MDLGHVEKAIAALLAVGALGTAAFGVVEAFGKALVFGDRGLPYVGFRYVKRLMADFEPALRFVYGDDFRRILTQQYRNGRGAGSAPETIRQGVRLALPLMDATEAMRVVSRTWGMAEKTETLVAALQAEKTGALGAAEAEAAATLAGRFAMALDSRVSAAFALAEERYQAIARLAAGFAAVALALVFNLGARGSVTGPVEGGYPWLIALIIGAAAVPLAPIAKDLTGALTEALRAWKQVGGAKA